MLVVLDLQNGLIGERALAASFKAIVEAQAEANRHLMLKMRIPKLYGSGIRFRNEPWAGKFEEVASACLVMKRGWGDCDDLCAYRIGELRNEGVAAKARIYWREHKLKTGKVRLFHVEVRLPDGSIEDPSRLLGM